MNFNQVSVLLLAFFSAVFADDTVVARKGSELRAKSVPKAVEKLPEIQAQIKTETSPSTDDKKKALATLLALSMIQEIAAFEEALAFSSVLDMLTAPRLVVLKKRNIKPSEPVIEEIVEENPVSAPAMPVVEELSEDEDDLVEVN